MTGRPQFPTREEVEKQVRADMNLRMKEIIGSPQAKEVPHFAQFLAWETDFRSQTSLKLMAALKQDIEAAKAASVTASPHNARAEYKKMKTEAGALGLAPVDQPGPSDPFATIVKNHNQGFSK